MRLLIVTAVLAALSCTSGSTLVLKHSSAPTKLEQVSVVTKAPASYEELAVVNCRGYGSFKEQVNLDNAMLCLKQKASAVGASTVILKLEKCQFGNRTAIEMNLPSGRNTVVPTSDNDILLVGVAIREKM